MEEKLSIDKKNLKNFIEYSGRSLCGKVLKRFDLGFNQNILKKEIKELIYEEMRNLKNLLITKGTDKDIIIFTNKENGKEWKKL